MIAYLNNVLQVSEYVEKKTGFIGNEKVQKYTGIFVDNTKKCPETFGRIDVQEALKL